MEILFIYTGSADKDFTSNMLRTHFRQSTPVIHLLFTPSRKKSTYKKQINSDSCINLRIRQRRRDGRTAADNAYNIIGDGSFFAEARVAF